MRKNIGEVTLKKNSRPLFPNGISIWDAMDVRMGAIILCELSSDGLFIEFIPLLLVKRDAFPG